MAKLPGNVLKLDEKTFRIKDGTVYLFLLIGSEKAMCIDTGMGQSKLDKVLPFLTDKPVFAANTHSHFDHIAGNYFFDKVHLSDADESIYREHVSYEYLSGLLYGLLDEKKIPKWIQNLSPVKKYISRIAAIPDKGNRCNLSEGMTFDLGGRTVRAYSVPGHTPGSMVFLDVERKWLYPGDMGCIGVMLNLPHSMPVRVYKESMEKLKKMAEQGLYDTIYPSHHTLTAPLSILDDYIACSQKIIDGKIEGKYSKSVVGDTYLVKYKQINIAYRKDNIG